jgi:ribonuclease D
VGEWPPTGREEKSPVSKENETCRFHDAPDDVRECLAAFAGTDLLALDLEAAGLHRYADSVCLVQAATRRVTAVLDPLPGREPFEGLGILLADGDTLKVFHGGDYDIRLLKRDFGFSPRRIFDTMIAAQLIGRKQVGLAALLEEEFGVRLDKKYQREDWSRRPLTEGMIAYAANDVIHLPELYDKLRDELARLGRLGWAEEEFRLLEAASPIPPKRLSAPDAKGANRFSPRELAVLQALLELRDTWAREWDRPPFKVLGNDLLLAWAQTPPKTRRAVTESKGASSSTLQRLAGGVLESVERALSLPPDQWPRRPELPPRMKPTDAAQARLARLKTARAEAAQALGVEPGLLANTATLEKLSLLEPEEGRAALPSLLKEWQREVLGERLAALLD